MRTLLPLSLVILFALPSCGALWGFEPLSDEDARADGRSSSDGGSAIDGEVTNDGATDVDVDAAVDGNEDSGPGPRCKGIAATCGPAANRDCCSATVVPGGTFYRSYDAVSGGGHEDTSFPATVSTFRLDDYEVTVGRFRVFVAAYPQSLPVSGAGKNPNLAADPGWDAIWNSQMPSSRADLISAIQCGAEQTWSENPGTNDALAMNCVSWYEAFAFCIWDGGRLPTEAEWNYAAAGGGGTDGQRAFPWSSPSTSTAIDTTYAVYNRYDNRVMRVGSRSPKGNGKWGHADLAGNVWEWVLDWEATYPLPCNDCANLATSTKRELRGGAWLNFPEYVRTAKRYAYPPSHRETPGGVRCARAQ